MKNSSNPSFAWKTNVLPKPSNKINFYCRLMNSFGLLPPPLNKIVRIFKSLILKQLTSKNIDFNHGCNILFGNLIGGPVNLNDAFILDYAPITFGKGVLIGPDCKIITSWHPEHDLHTVYAEPIVFGDNVWLMMNIIVLPGVEIGSNTIIGAGSVVTKSIPANVIAAGNPARVIRQKKSD